MDSSFYAIFKLPDIDLNNRISISTQFDYLEKSSSTTPRPKLWRLCAGYRLLIVLKMFTKAYPTYDE